MTRFAIPCVLTVLVSACATSPAVSTGSQRIHTVDSARVQGLHVPAGTRLSIRLGQTIGTTVSTRGDRFTAVVSRPLVDPSGVVVVPSGSHVIGRVTSVQGATGPRLRFDLEQIETRGGAVPIDARVEAASAEIYRGQSQYSMVLVGPDSLLEATHADASRRARVYAGERIGGGPSAYFYRVYRPRQVTLPVGATLDLVLTRPIFAPGTYLLPR